MTEQTVTVGLTAQQQLLLDRLAASTQPADFPCSYAQRRQWLLHQLAPTSTSYAMPFALRLRGDLDLPALQNALDDVVERHEALRTTFPSRDGQPRQRVDAFGRVRIEPRELAEGDRLDDHLRAVIAEAFDLERGPLLRVVVWPLAPGEHVLLAVAHHIIADGRSVEILLRDLAAAYRGDLAADRPPALHPVDHAVWEAGEISAGAVDDDLAYWAAELDDPPAPLALPTELARTPEASGPMARLHGSLTGGLGERVREAARRLGTTDFVLLLSTFSVTLARFCGTPDLVVGVPVSGRVRPEMGEMVGCFVNTLPVRLGCDGRRSAGEQVVHAHAKSAAALAHDRAPLDLIVSRATTHRDTGSTAPFQVVFTMRDAAQTDIDFDGLTGLPIDVAPADAKLDLTCVVIRDQAGVKGGYRFEWDYRADRYDDRTIGSLAGCFEAVAEQLLADPERRIADLDLGRVADDQEQDAGGQATGLLEEFARSVALHPDRPAVTDRDTTISYLDLDRRANRLGNRLRAGGVVAETPVGICLPRGIAFAVACLAIVKAGGNYVPLDPAYPPDRLRYMVADSGIRLVVSRPDLAGLLPDTLDEVLDGTDESADWPDTDPGGRIHPESLCLRVYTSGSTGRPKAVGVTHRGVLDLVYPGAYAGFGPDESVLWISSVSFDMATWEIWGTLLHGAHGVVSPEREHSAGQIGRLIRTHGVTTALFSTALLNALVDEDVTCFRGMRTLLVGGEALSPAHMRALRTALPATRLVNAYGPAEITTIATCRDIGPDDVVAASIPIGRPVSGTRVTVADQDGRAAPAGALGELWLSGSGLARGYVGRPRLTAERFVPAPGGQRWYRTGDLGRMVGEDAFSYRGRLDRQLKIRGYRVEPGEVEAILAEQDEVARAAVVAHRTGNGDTRLVAYVVPAEGGSVDGLRERLRLVMPDYLVPAAVLAVDEIPRTGNDKVDTAALPAPVWTAGPTLPATRTPAEEAVASIWAEVLSVDAGGIGPDDDFFAIGGHSLLAATVASRLGERLGVDLPLADVFNRPTMAELAAAVDECRTLVASDEDVAGGPTPLAPNQQRLWFLQQLDPDSTVYNLPLAVRISGELDVDALRASVRWLIERHEVLRTVVTETADGQVASVRPIDDVPPLRVLDVSGEQAAVDAVHAELRTPFALATGELPIRTVLANYGESEHIACLVVHHIVADGWSVGVIAEELGAAYTAFAAGRAPSPAPLALQYADVVERQRRRLAGGGLNEQARFWQQALSGAPQVLDLPATRCRPASRRLRGALAEFALDPELVAGVRELANARGCTEYMVLLAALSATLAARTGQAEFLVGTPVANRPDRASQQLVGFFANTLALRMDTAGDPSVEAMLDRVRGTCRDAFAHPDLPFEKVVEDLAPDRDLSRSPLFQVMFAFDNTPGSSLRLAGLDVRQARLDNPVARVDLTLSLTSRPDAIGGVCEYDADLFDADDVAELLRHLRSTIEQFVRRPAAPLSEIQPPAACPALVGPDATDGTPDLVRLVEAHAQRSPELPAITATDGVTWTYGELWERAGRWAAALAARGVPAGGAIATRQRVGPELVATVLGAWRHGVAIARLDPDQQPESADLRVSVVVADGTDLDQPAEPPTDPPATEGLATAVLARTADGHDVWLRTTHAALRAAYAGVGAAWWPAGGCTAVRTDSGADTVVLDVVGPLAAGSRLAFVDPASLPEREVTTMHADGATWRSLVESGWSPAAGLRAVCPVEDLDSTLAAALLEGGAELWTFYGEPETPYAVSGRIVSPDRIAVAGQVSPGLRLEIRTRTGVVAATGARGELWIGTETAPGGRMSEVDGRGWLRTGTLAHLDACGWLHVDGQTGLRPRGRATTAPPAAPALPAKRPPTGDLEIAIAEVWAEVLGPDLLGAGGIDDANADFFALGGQSFLAARVAARLSRRFGTGLTVRVIFEHPTVAGLAEQLGADQPAADQPAAEQSGPAPAARPDDEPVRLDESVSDAPLSFAQERLWFLTQFAPESPAYNIPLVARLDGALDRAAFLRALGWVVARHESLRTRFGTHDHQPWQRVIPAVEAVPSLLDVDVSAEAEPLHRAMELSAEFAFAPFDLDAGELPIRAMLVTVTPRRQVVALCVHHLAADGWAIGLLVRDLCAAYSAFREGAEPAATALPLRYVDYARWQRRPDAGLDAGLDFWTEALREAPQALDLPASRPRPVVRRHRGAGVRFDLAAGLTERIRTLARGAECTEFMVLFAALSTVLSRYAAQRDLLIGTPVANRDEAGTESLLGLLTNTVVLRADLRADRTVGELLRDARSTCLDAFAHSDTPFEQVVERVASQRDPSRSPLFQVMLALNNAPPPVLELPGLDSTPIEQDNPTAKFDIVLNLADQRDRIAGVCEFDVDVYDQPMIESLLAALTRTLDEFATDPHARLSTIDIVDEPERRALVQDFNRTPARYEHRTCLHHLVEDAVDRDPAATAVVSADTGQAIDYGTLDRAANRLAHRLIDSGVRPGDVVAVCAERSAELVVAEFAVLKAGAAYLPVDPAWPAGRTATVTADAGCRLVLTAAGSAPDLPPGLDVVTVDLEDRSDGRSDGPDTRPNVEVGPDDIAYVVYTSGSTGRPKGVQVQHAAIANNLLWMQQDWPLTAADSMLHKTASTFDVSVKEVFWPLLAGARLVLAERGSQRDPESLLEQIERHAVTITHFVPSMLELALDAAGRRGRGLGSTLRYVMCGAETLSASTGRRFFAACDARLLHMYGPTETAIAVTGWTCRSSADLRLRVPLGRPMPNCALYVLDDDLNPTPRGAWGELYVAGPPVARGYLGRPAETARAFLPDPFLAVPGGRMYRTGDVVRHGDGGLLEFRGRRDSQVKVRGFRVELGEVEAVLRGHPGVRQAVATLSGSSQSDAGIAAYVVTDAVPPGQHLRDYARQHLPDHMVPTRFVVLDRLPLNANGKVDRSALPGLGDAERDLDSEFVAPRDEVEEAVARVWTQVLGVSPIGVHDDFFALGGHSLQTAQIAGRLRELFDREVPIRGIFAEPTVETVARLLRAAPERTTAPRIPSRRTTGRTPATPSIRGDQ